MGDTWLVDAFGSSSAVCAYFALVLLMLVLVFYVVHSGSSERLENQNYIYTSGADQRFAGEFSGANQGDYTTGYNFNVPLQGDDGAEHLTASPDEPDLWAVGSDIDAYKTGITGQTVGLDVNRGGMGMQNMTTEGMADDPYESLLEQQLRTGA
jgi:hypothetical protein